MAAGGMLALLASCTTTTGAFTQLDTTRDDSGSRDEFSAYTKREVFTRVDVNGDAVVTKGEWENVNPFSLSGKEVLQEFPRSKSLAIPES